MTIHFDDIFASKKNIDELCSENRKKTNILIANFIKKTDGDDDDFSTLLYGKLDSYTQNDDSINLKRIDKYISVNGKEYRDSVGKVFQENCSNTGLLIFGKRKDSNFFLCRIYSQNFFNQKTRYFYRENKNIIYIENPDILDFSIKSEVKIISTFIMGLLRYHNNDFESSNKLIDSALRLNKNKDDQQFVTICHLFKGDNFIRSNQPLKAVAEYQCGLLSDPNNLYLHHNLGVIYLKLGKEKDAKVEFETAKRINKGAKDSIISIYPIYLSKKRPIKKDSFFIRRDSGTIIGDILPKRKGQLKDWAKEECNVFYDNGNYGVMNNNGDTIVRGRYKSIEKFIYKNVDCFITFSGYKYGIVFHRHLDDGFSTFEIIPEYPGDKVKTKATTWIDLNENALIKFVEKKVNYKN
ncbi:hypothetical protein GCM10022210_25070 [Mucilaginibacter dorajii]|uniref:Tetratricopeptide repeat protein n=1 Tax=Mucilaginibacter dorajii TaxID=692994 RepID=A0ABP7PZ58_9SPHI